MNRNLFKRLPGPDQSQQYEKCLDQGAKAKANSMRSVAAQHTPVEARRVPQGRGWGPAKASYCNSRPALAGAGRCSTTGGPSLGAAAPRAVRRWTGAGCPAPQAGVSLDGAGHPVPQDRQSLGAAAPHPPVSLQRPVYRCVHPGALHFSAWKQNGGLIPCIFSS